VSAVPRAVPGRLAWALLACFLWGSAFPSVKAGLQWFEPTFFAGARFALAGAVVLVISLFRPGAWPLPAGTFSRLLAVGALQTAVGYWFFFHGLANGNAVSGAIINSSGPLVTLLLARLMLDEAPLGPWRSFGVLLGFAGTALAMLGRAGGFGAAWRGEGYILLSTLAMSYASVMAKDLVARVDPFVLSGVSMASGGIMLLGLAAAAGGAVARAPIGGTALAILAYTVLISAAAFTIWFRLLRDMPVTLLSSVKFTIPIFAAILSRIVVGERLTPMRMAGTALVGIGLLMVFRRRGGVEERGKNAGGDPVRVPAGA
jgi:drug/metabolite transporter (DMT)-like permease